MNKCGLFVVGGLLSLVSSLMAISPEDIQESYYKSYNYEKMGDYPDAIKSLSEVYAAYPKTYTVNLRLGYLYFTSGYYANAMAHYDLAILALPDAIDPKLGKMLVLMTREKYEDAATLGYQILKLDYMNYYANLRLAYILRLQKKYDLAEKLNLKLLTIYPTDVTFLTEYGALQYAQSNWEKAEAIFQDVLILDPENVDARSFLELLKTAKLTPKPTPSVKETMTKKKVKSATKS
jgi:tetratricopeptide (TPR) repeat protein